MIRTIYIVSFVILISLPQYANSQNSWFQQDDFPGDARSGAVSAVVGDKGYYGTGLGEGGNRLKDWWMFDRLSGSWSQLPDFPGNARNNALAFSIDSLIYVMTGFDGSVYFKDAYVYNPQSTSWRQLNDFPGLERSLAVASVLNNAAYIGTGKGSNDQLKDWWVYDPLTDSWTRKADLPSDKRQSAISFSLAGQVFVGGGVNYDGGTFLTNNLYSYDPTTNSWTEKSFAESHLGSLNSTAFVLGDTAYVFGGSSGMNLYKYSANSNEWISAEKLQVDGEDNRTNSSAMAFGDLAYIIGGNYYDFATFQDVKKKEVWKYYAVSPLKPNNLTRNGSELDYNKIQVYWTDENEDELGYVVKLSDRNSGIEILRDTLPPNQTSFEVAAEENTKYILTVWAYNEVGMSDYLNYYVRTPYYLGYPMNFEAKGLHVGSVKLTWQDVTTREDGFIIEMSKDDTLSFQVIDTIAADTERHIVHGLGLETMYYFRLSTFISDTLQSKYAWAYPGVSFENWGAWEEVPNAGFENIIMFGDYFTIGNKFYYLNTSAVEEEKRRLMEFDSESQTWTEKAKPFHFYNTNLFVIGQNAYFVSGSDKDGLLNTVYKYDQAADSWIKMNDFPGKGRSRAAAFSLDNKGYIIAGDTVANTSGKVQTKTVWEYDPSNDSWVQKNDFPGGNRTDLVSFTSNNAAYIGLGDAYSGEDRDNIWQYYKIYRDFYKYDPATDTWQQLSDFPGTRDFKKRTMIGDGTNGILVGDWYIYDEEEADNWWIFQPEKNRWTIFADIEKQNNRYYYPFELNGEFHVLSRNETSLDPEIYRYNDALLSDTRDLEAKLVLPDSALFTWSYIDPDATGVIVQKKNGNKFDNIDTLSVDKKEFVLYDLSPRTFQQYRIKSFNDAVTSAGSNEVNIYVPGAPYLYDFIQTSVDSAKILYSPAAKNAKVLMEKSVDFGDWITIDTLPSGITSTYQFIKVDFSAEHTAVRLTTMLESAYNMVSETLALTKFKPPTNMQVKWINQGEVNISWQNNSKFDSSYHVILKDSLQLGNQLKVTLDQGQYDIDIQVDNSLLEETELFLIYLQADFGGYEKYFEERVGTLHRILAPKSLEYEVIGSHEINLKWHDVSRIEEGYTILLLTDASENIYDTLTTVNNNTVETQLDLTNLADIIELKVAAFNSELALNSASESIEVNNRITGTTDYLEVVKVYPNPAVNHIVLDNNGRKQSVIITNKNGSVIYMKEITTKQRINVQNWPSGIYFVNVDGAIFKLLIQ